MPTIFSKLISWELPSYKLYEDEYTYAFLDINPIQKGHVLIVPKCEVDYFADVPEPYYSRVFQVAKELAPAIQKATGCKRVALSVIWYEAPHFHCHLIPTNSGSADTFRPLAEKATHEELKAMQEKILHELKNL